MKTFILCLGAVLVGNAVLAQSVPVPKIGRSCPSGTYSSGGSCVPTANNQVYLNPSRSSCPQNWVRSGNGNYCVR